MSRSRRQAWLRDELILALDLYRRAGRNPSSKDATELSDTLRSIPIEADLAEDAAFRNVAAVRLKIANFVSIDPDADTVGMTRGGRGDQKVFDEFKTNPQMLASVAAAIRANLDTVSRQEADEEEEDIADAHEGALLTRVHRVRERNSGIVQRRKDHALQKCGRLACEGCDFDFAIAYGERGEGYIECHHIVPLYALRKSQRTRLADLALVCSNCHRMIHRQRDWLTIEQVRKLAGA